MKNESEYKSISETMTDLAEAMSKTVGDGFLEKPLRGLLITFEMDISTDESKRISKTHSDQSKTQVICGGMMVGNAPRTLARLLADMGPAQADKFMMSVQGELLLALLEKATGASRSEELLREEKPARE